MPKGFEGAQKSAASLRSGGGMIKWPKGLQSFKLKRHNEQAVIRFIQNHDDIEWVRKWKLPPTASFKYGEMVNAVDQFDNGTPDPGIAAGLKQGWRAYPLLIHRNRPVLQKDKDGRAVRDGNGNYTIVGYADQIVVWEISNAVYNELRSIEGSMRGLTQQDLKVTRIGEDQNTKYSFFPEGEAGGLSAADQQLIATQRPDISPLVKVPTFEELQAYLNGGVVEEEPSFQEMATSNAGGLEGNPFA